MSHNKDKNKTDTGSKGTVVPKAANTTGKTAATPSASNKALDEKNIALPAKAITKEKDLKYIYPTDCITLDQRKTFRRKARATMKRFEKTIANLQASNEENAQIELAKEVTNFESWKASTLETKKEAIPTA